MVFKGGLCFFAVIGSTFANRTLNLKSSSLYLPEVALKEILKNVSDQATMLECRLVCTQWNNLIVDTSELIRKITFPVWHPRPFLDLDLVKQRKVKSICLKFLPVDYGWADDFFFAISNMTIEKVSFELEERSEYNERRLLQRILERCTCLQELEVNYSINKLFRSISSSSSTSSSDDSEPATRDDKANNAMKLKIISVDIDGFEEADARGLSNFLLSYPNLEEINFLGDRIYGVETPVFYMLLAGICKYLQKFGKTLKLKVNKPNVLINCVHKFH